MIEISKENHVYSHSRNNLPVARAGHGEYVLFHTLDCYNGMVTSSEKPMEEQFPHDTPNNPATGPVFIEDAEPGDILAVDILEIQIATTGVVSNEVNRYPLAADQERIYCLPITDRHVTFKDVTWAIEPMIGVIGLPMDSDEEIPTMYVYPGGGNMDNRRITTGTTVYLPVRVPGGLLALGDLHATMGDGEVCGNGLEVEGTVLTRVRLIKQTPLNWPVIETDQRWYVNTCGKTTDEAIRAGYEEMQRLIAQAYDWDLTDAAIYMTLHGYVEASQACLVPGGGGNSMRIGTDKISTKAPLISAK